jgi:hypothetical protein
MNETLETSRAITLFNEFFENFNQNYIVVFLKILDNLDIKLANKTELKRKLNNGYKLISELKPTYDQKDPQSLYRTLFLLEDWLAQMTAIIDKIFNKLIRIRTQIILGNKKWVSLMEQYKVALREWTILVEPLRTMKAIPIYKPKITNTIAESRQVNTFNQYNKSIRLPQAKPYEGNHFEEMPLGTAMNSRITMKRKIRKPSKKPKSKAMGTSLNGPRVQP